MFQITIRRKNIFKLAAAAAFIVLTIFLWPQFKNQVPKTKEELAQTALAEVSQIPGDAPVQLITEPDAGIAPVEAAITSAKKSLDMTMYELENPALEQLLADAKNRGVLVRVILQNVSAFGKRPNQDAYDFLKNHQVAVMWAEPYFALTHQKTITVDGAWSLIMTFNLNPKYYSSSRDFAVADYDATDVSAIEAAFDNDWTGRQIPAGNGSDLVWSPGSAYTLLAMINSATKTLDVYNEEMADPRIQQALEAAAVRGVAVRLVMTYATNWKPAFTELSGAGVAVRTYASTADLYIHAKVILVDGQKAFVGSENFSVPSLDSNRELGILITKPEVVNSLEATFAQDFDGARTFGN